ncbi:hypothetical protein CspeluHIS016_0105200 [Cutaneotrichosporon spelunceum]|uniref:Rab-GAP TBC domain-containing protein n=1 Tax=Cutaneotrichosporon spelunceum TaxID=1672016 RepID=A0AAD3Y9R0_9TREE|nr:hypothetical protein CspeluHIS016_0105200 [Cutaneotrichosporon spelunceum]
MRRLDPRVIDDMLALAARGGLGQATALDDCVAQGPDQLMYIQGDTLILLKDDGDELLACCQGEIGWVKRYNILYDALASGSGPSSPEPITPACLLAEYQVHVGDGSSTEDQGDDHPIMHSATWDIMGASSGPEDTDLQIPDSDTISTQDYFARAPSHPSGAVSPLDGLSALTAFAVPQPRSTPLHEAAMCFGGPSISGVTQGNVRRFNAVEHSTSTAPQRHSLLVEAQRFSELSRNSELSRLSEVGTVGTVDEESNDSDSETDRDVAVPSPTPSTEAIPPARPPRRRPVALDLDNRDSIGDDSDCSTARIGGESPIPHTPMSMATFGGDGLRSRELLLSPDRFSRGNGYSDNRISDFSNSDLADDEGEPPVEALLSPPTESQDQMPLVQMPSFFSANRRVFEPDHDDGSDDGTIGLAYNESPRSSLESLGRSSATCSTTKRRRSPDISVSDETLLDTPQSLPISKFRPPIQARSCGSGSSHDGSTNGLAPPFVIDDKPRFDHLSVGRDLSPPDALSPADIPLASPMSTVHDSPTSFDSRWSIESRVAAKNAARNGFYALGHHPQFIDDQRQPAKDASATPAAIVSQVSIAPSTLSIMPEPSTSPKRSGDAQDGDAWANARPPPVARLLPTTMAPDTGPTLLPRTLGSLDSKTTPPATSGLDPSPMIGTVAMQSSASPENTSQRKAETSASRQSPLDSSMSPRSEAQRRQGMTLVGRMETDLSHSRYPVPITFRYDDDGSQHSSPASQAGPLSPPQHQRYNSPRPAPPAPSAPGYSPSPPYRKPSLGSNGHGATAVTRSSSFDRPSLDSPRRYTPDGRQHAPSESSHGHQATPSPLSGPPVNRLGQQHDMPARPSLPVENGRYGTPSSERSCTSTPSREGLSRIVSPPMGSKNRSVSDDHHMQTFQGSFKPILPSAAARTMDTSQTMAEFLGKGLNETSKTWYTDESGIATSSNKRTGSSHLMNPTFTRRVAPTTSNSSESSHMSSNSSVRRPPQAPTHRARSRSFSAAIAKSFGRKPSLDLPPPMPAVSVGRKPSLDLGLRKPSLELGSRFPIVSSGYKRSLDFGPRQAFVTAGSSASPSPNPGNPSKPVLTDTGQLDNSMLGVGSWKSSSRLSANSTKAVHHMKIGDSVHHMSLDGHPVPAIADDLRRNPSLQLERSAPLFLPPSQPNVGHQRSTSGPSKHQRSASGSGSWGQAQPLASTGISSKDYADPTVKTDGMEFEILQPRKVPAPVVKLNLDASDLGLLPPEELARDGLVPMVPDTPPETDEWGFLRDRSPTPAIFQSRKTAGDIRYLEQKWRATISTPLSRGADIPKKVKRTIIEQGVPASLRGRTWGWLMSNGSSGRVPGLFQRLVSNEPSPYDAQIDQDVPKVYADHAVFFRPGSPGQQDLRTLLRAFLHFMPNGYRSELALIAGALLIHAVIEDAFWLMAGLFNSVLKTYYVKDRLAFRVDLHVFGGILHGTDPQLARLFADVGVSPQDYLPRWWMGMFIRSIPWPTVLRFFDATISEGPRYVFIASLAILTLSRDRLLGLPRTREAVLGYLHRLPQDNLLLPDTFIRACDAVKLSDADLKKLRTSVKASLSVNSGRR